MLKWIIFSFCCLLALVGLSEVICQIVLLLKRPSKKPFVYTVAMPQKDMFDEQLDYVISQSVWKGDGISQKTLVIIPKGTVIKNREVIEENYNIEFCERI